VGAFGVTIRARRRRPLTAKKLDTVVATTKIDAMDAAEQLVPVETDRLTWAEICARYSDQYVCLVDVVRPPLSSPEIITARVVGHGATHDAAFEPIRDLDQQYPRFTIRYTGVCTETLIRPSLVLDDETLELLRS
jgi:hypothetical protein